MVYNQDNMLRRRKKKNRTVNENQAGSLPSIQAPDSDISPPAVVGAHKEIKTSPLLSDAFKSTIEKAADRSRNELVSEGKIKPMAFFLNTDGTMKTVSLFVRDEHQKEALIRRIQDKVLAENIPTVIVLSEIDNEHGMLLSGTSFGMKGSARVDYSFDNKTKTVTSWKITWLSQYVQNVLLDGIFDKKD
jgi:hypothetical protein